MSTYPIRMMDHPLNGPVVALATGTAGPNNPLSPESIVATLKEYGVQGCRVWRVPRGQIELPKLAEHLAPWDFIVIETSSGSIVLLDWHGPGHLWSPSGVPWNALVASLIFLGVTHLINSSAVGTYISDASYEEGGMHVEDLAIVGQVDCSSLDEAFFRGPPVHLHFAHPTCQHLDRFLLRVVADDDEDLFGKVHAEADYLTIRGDRFATALEASVRKQLGYHLSGMTYGRVAVLLREAGIHVSTIAKLVDEDAWRLYRSMVVGKSVSKDQVEKALGVTGRKCAALQRVAVARLLTNERDLLTQCEHCTPGILAHVHGDPEVVLSHDQRQLAAFLERRSHPRWAV